MTFAQLVVLWLSRSRAALTAHLHRWSAAHRRVPDDPGLRRS